MKNPIEKSLLEVTLEMPNFLTKFVRQMIVYLHVNILVVRFGNGSKLRAIIASRLLISEALRSKLSLNLIQGSLIDAFQSSSGSKTHMESFWSDNGAPDAWHFLIVIYFAFGFLAARLFFDRFIFCVVKCSESLWKLTYYATVEACILKISYQEPWFRDTKEYFKGWPNQELGLPLKLLYMGQCGFYTYSFVALLTWETRRKDFSVMMGHHVITVLLIGFSYITSFFRIGSIILALHDASDVFLEAAKVFKYSEKELAASVLFGFFAFSWLILRLIFFPFWVIRSSSYDLIDCLDLSKPAPRALYYVFNTMLLMLFVFHLYWWVMICAMIRRQLKNRGKVGEDIRSDSEDDD